MVIFCILFCFTKTHWYMDLKVNYYRNRLQDSFSRQFAQYEEIAKAFINSLESPYYTRLGTSEHVTNAMYDNIETIQKDCIVAIDKIYIADETYDAYPINACVFSTTVERGEFVYAWVELVYSTRSVESLFSSYDEAVENQFIIELSDNWYIMTHYGY